MQISYFKRLTREQEIHNYLSFGHLFPVTTCKWKGGQMTNYCKFHVLLLIVKHEIFNSIIILLWLKINSSN